MPRYYHLVNSRSTRPATHYRIKEQSNPISKWTAIGIGGVVGGAALIGAGLYLNSVGSTITPPGGGGTSPGGGGTSCSCDTSCAYCDTSQGAWSCVNGECAVSCPPSCTSNSDCSGCGSGFVCDGSCYSPEASNAVINPLTITIPTSVSYCVGQYIWNQNTEYDFSYAGGQSYFDVVVYDQKGNVLAGVPISWTINATNSPFTAQAMPISSGGGGSGSLGGSGQVLTGTGGARVIVTAPSTPQNFSDSSLPNSQGAGPGMLGPYTLGTISVTADSLPSTSVLVLATVSYPQVPACPGNVV